MLNFKTQEILQRIVKRCIRIEEIIKNQGK